MKRRNFVLTSLAELPVVDFTQIKTHFTMRTNKGFRVESDEARFGIHYKVI